MATVQSATSIIKLTVVLVLGQVGVYALTNVEMASGHEDVRVITPCQNMVEEIVLEKRKKYKLVLEVVQFVQIHWENVIAFYRRCQCGTMLDMTAGKDICNLYLYFQ
ncbi:uncharacterized protein LOC128555245 [Mercenaria mercenaria]|uniref:uncharacterized protein LOC128555245 n=1 Tax=Mercenaria mercenaria TaxID=6596 RepID=UPI00234F8856|nr:uncharacterized protein LOC128555245 [Mercenaria mercenaria]